MYGGAEILFPGDANGGVRVAILGAGLTPPFLRVILVRRIAHEVALAILALVAGRVIEALETVPRVVLVFALGIPVTLTFCVGMGNRNVIAEISFLQALEQMVSGSFVISSYIISQQTHVRCTYLM